LNHGAKPKGNRTVILGFFVEEDDVGLVYGYRWISEAAFSSIKRSFGEYVCSVKWKHIVNELILKAKIYNLFIAMNL
jgi:transposase